MSKIAVVFWSGTGNTEVMANAVAEGAKEAGADVEIFQVDEFNVTDMADYNGFLFGCPAMGDEVLEEDSFEPFFSAAEEQLDGIPVGLFGSYGWGGGAWMESWIERTKGTGAKLFKEEGLIAENAPDDDVLAECKALGADFVKSF